MNLIDDLIVTVVIENTTPISKERKYFNFEDLESVKEFYIWYEGLHDGSYTELVSVDSEIFHIRTVDDLFSYLKTVGTFRSMSESKQVLFSEIYQAGYCGEVIDLARLITNYKEE